MSASRPGGGRPEARIRWRFAASAAFWLQRVGRANDAEYERIRSAPTHFVVLPGHEIPAVERVVERTGGYVVVKKLGHAGEVAQETDPRIG
jgi:hypothetical protein